MSKAEKKVYVGMAADIIHEGHINIITEARKLGYVIVGILTDEAIASYKRIPFTPYRYRKVIVENLKGVDEVIPQDTLDYVPNLKKIKPDILVHGDDWKTGVQKKTRQRAIDAINEWNGKLIEPKYTKGVSSSQLIEALKERGITPDMRLKSLRLMLSVKPVLRVMEAHNGITGLIVEKTKVQEDGGVR
ncbi:MAG: adenylyltransferase/cytidyltransferase family protein, partial [Candidatus Neomarinimicrobiota bacterium]